MSSATLARNGQTVSSQEFRLPDLDPEAVRRVRLSLAAWAACGLGTTRSWRMSTLPGHGGVHVVVKMPAFDAASTDVLGQLLDVICRLQHIEHPVDTDPVSTRQAA